MIKIHFSIQGKGGCGKTTDAAFMAQYLVNQDRYPLCLDADPVNRSFAAYKSLDVHEINVLDGNKIHPKSWDAMLNLLLQASEDAVVDVGATSFIAILDYMSRMDMIRYLHDHGRQVYMHIPVTGSEGMIHTVNGMVQIINQFQDQNTRFAIWLNPFLGPIERNGQQFEQFEEFLKLKSKIEAIIKIPAFPPDLHGEDLKSILTQNMTFTEALTLDTRSVQDPGSGEDEEEKYSVHGLSLATLQRLTQMQREIFVAIRESQVFD
ncbi:MAG: hypothetical protein LBK03_00990 [Bacteroidales bacterium]|jgi:hypothetical protein|nr:hypothetical protein [Bacteroidales bacterium]